MRSQNRPQPYCEGKSEVEVDVWWKNRDVGLISKRPVVPHSTFDFSKQTQNWIHNVIYNLVEQGIKTDTAALDRLAIYASIGINGLYRYHMSCSSEALIPRLAIRFIDRLISREHNSPVPEEKQNNGVEDEQDQTSQRFTTSDIFFEVSLLFGPYWENKIKMALELLDDPTIERIEVQRVERVANPGDQEDLFLIRGTNVGELVHLIPNIMASYFDSVDHGCTFQLSAAVSRTLSNKFEKDRWSVSGHSLGGSATQFIAADRHSNSNYYSDVEFRAYSFNSAGRCSPRIHSRID